MCWQHLQDFHYLLDCPAYEPSCKFLFGSSLHFLLSTFGPDQEVWPDCRNSAKSLCSCTKHPSRKNPKHHHLPQSTLLRTTKLETATKSQNKNYLSHKFEMKTFRQFATDFPIVLNNVVSANMFSSGLSTHESSFDTQKGNSLFRLCPQLPWRN